MIAEFVNDKNALQMTAIIPLTAIQGDKKIVQFAAVGDTGFPATITIIMSANQSPKFLLRGIVTSIDDEVGDVVSYAVKWQPQDLGEDGKAQARKNIGINPEDKTSAMTNPVGVDSDGKLWSQADTSLNMTGATVGQIAKITAVDDSGKPTAWEAVDMPSGGVGEWELVSNTTIAEPVSEITASIPQGKTELLMFARGKYGTRPSNQRVGFKVNGLWRLSGYTIAPTWRYFKMRFMLLPNGMAWIEQQENNMPMNGTCTIGLDCDNNGGIYEPSNYGATGINKVSFSMIGTDGTLDTGFQFIVFAR